MQLAIHENNGGNDNQHDGGYDVFHPYCECELHIVKPSV